MLFRQPYLDGLGKTQAELDAGPTVLEASLLQIVGNLLMAFVLAWLLARLGVNSAAQGMKVALLVWFGFMAALIVPLHAYQAFSLTFSAINIGYALVAMAVMGAIIGGWKREVQK